MSETDTDPLNRSALSAVAGLRTGGPERDRTADLLNANQALSQLSYRPKGVSRQTVLSQRTHWSSRSQTGGPNRNCTCDPRVISTVLCSLSYRPVGVDVLLVAVSRFRKQKTDAHAFRFSVFCHLVTLVTRSCARGEPKAPAFYAPVLTLSIETTQSVPTHQWS